MSKIISLEEVEKRIFDKFGNDIKISNYKKFSDYADFECNNKHKWNEIVNNLFKESFKGCRICRGIKPQRNQKLSLEDAKKQLFKFHGENIIILEFDGTNSPAHFLCNICKHDWWVTAGPTLRGHGCPNCRGDKISNSKRTLLKDIIFYIESQNCKYIKGDYKNNNSKLYIQFECEHKNWISFVSFQQGSRCAKCAIQIRNSKLRTPLEKILKIFSDNNLEFIEFPNGYKNQSSIIKYKCEYNHITIRRVDVLFRNKTCKECSRINRMLSFSGSNAKNWQGGKNELLDGMKSRMIDWKKESMEFSNYKCVITGDRFDNIHHLYSFNLILKEALNNLELEYFRKFSYYSDNELVSIYLECTKLHKKYGLGVCLRSDIHDLFHSYYGCRKNTPEQFEEFKQRIASGEIIIPN